MRASAAAKPRAKRVHFRVLAMRTDAAPIPEILETARCDAVFDRGRYYIGNPRIDRFVPMANTWSARRRPCEPWDLMHMAPLVPPRLARRPPCYQLYQHSQSEVPDMVTSPARGGRSEASRAVPVTLPGASARLLQDALKSVPGLKLLSFKPGSTKGGDKGLPAAIVSEARARSLHPSEGETVYVVLDTTVLSTEDLEYIGTLAGGSTRQDAAQAAGTPNQPEAAEASTGSKERRWGALREGFLREWDSVLAGDLARLTGSRSTNLAARAYAWRKAGKVFSVNDGTAERFPLFQIKEGQPRPVIARVISALGGTLSPWELALWFTTPHPDLGEWRRPVDLVDEQPEAVAGAARSSAGEVVY